MSMNQIDVMALWRMRCIHYLMLILGKAFNLQLGKLLPLF